MLSYKILMYGPSCLVNDSKFKIEMLVWLKANCLGKCLIERYPGCHAIAFNDLDDRHAFSEKFK